MFDPNLFVTFRGSGLNNSTNILLSSIALKELYKSRNVEVIKTATEILQNYDILEVEKNMIQKCHSFVILLP